jgi:hypothetical protein
LLGDDGCLPVGEYELVYASWFDDKPEKSEHRGWFVCDSRDSVFAAYTRTGIYIHGHANYRSNTIGCILVGTSDRGITTTFDDGIYQTWSYFLQDWESALEILNNNLSKDKCRLVIINGE